MNDNAIRAEVATTVSRAIGRLAGIRAKDPEKFQRAMALWKEADALHDRREKGEDIPFSLIRDKFDEADRLLGLL